MTVVGPAVFVVDDDPSVRKSLTRLIASARYAVETFASAREFLAREPYAGPCCLVLDVRMPGLTGLDLRVTEKLRAGSLAELVRLADRVGVIVPKA
jgi:FixJ family two-component response regulator